jgi:signal transduction histidine kinase
MRFLNLTCLLAIPLAVQDETEKKLIGALFLGRRENAAYQQDDIVRLTILADHIAALIDSDRRRKLAISLLERQRLMRDIHDSVSQKLYGLVALTEAAQAGIEAGSEMDYEHVMSRIGENARQAVKELRLFLFQMQPNNLEKEGLISVLHHRLAAVEGRADIKVRFLADEPIHLTKRKEIALYYIAQEALNNILRHARAKSVSVTLKQGYKYVTLEIADDGCGFDQSNIKKGGLGLENIKERVKQENGKLKISSKPNKGTVIKVTFKQSKLANSKGKN